MRLKHRIRQKLKRINDIYQFARNRTTFGDNPPMFEAVGEIKHTEYIKANPDFVVLVNRAYNEIKPVLEKMLSEIPVIVDRNDFGRVAFDFGSKNLNEYNDIVDKIDTLKKSIKRNIERIEYFKKLIDKINKIYKINGGSKRRRKRQMTIKRKIKKRRKSTRRRNR